MKLYTTDGTLLLLSLDLFEYEFYVVRTGV